MRGLQEAVLEREVGQGIAGAGEVDLCLAGGMAGCVFAEWSASDALEVPGWLTRGKGLPAELAAE